MEVEIMAENERVVNTPFFLRHNIIALILGAILVCLPFISQGYIYQMIMANADIKVHTNIISQFASGDLASPANIGYPAQIIWAFIMSGFVKLGLSPNIVFLAFMGLVLFCSGVCLYKMSRLGNQQAGWLTLLIGMLCTNSVLILYKYGIIYNILNMSLLLPVIILSAINYFKSNQFKWVSLYMITLLLFSMFHYSTLYVIPFCLIASLVLIVHNKVKHSPIRKYIKFIGMTAWLNAIVLGLLVYIYVKAGNPTTVPWDITLVSQPNIDLPKFFNILSPSTIILAIVAITIVVACRKIIKLSVETKRLLFILLALSLVVASITFAMVFTNVDSLLIDRLILDLAGIVAIIVAVLLAQGLMVKNKLAYYSKYLSYMVIGITSVMTLIVWIK